MCVRVCVGRLLGGQVVEWCVLLPYTIHIQVNQRRSEKSGVCCRPRGSCRRPRCRPPHNNDKGKHSLTNTTAMDGLLESNGPQREQGRSQQGYCSHLPAVSARAPVPFGPIPFRSCVSTPIRSCHDGWKLYTVSASWHAPRPRQPLATMADLEGAILQALNASDVIEDSGDFAKQQGVEHMAVVGMIKSLQAADMILAAVGGGAARPGRGRGGWTGVGGAASPCVDLGPRISCKQVSVWVRAHPAAPTGGARKHGLPSGVRPSSGWRRVHSAASRGSCALTFDFSVPWSSRVC